jgi:hypothetical protein
MAAACQLAQREEQQDSRSGLKQDVGEMVPPRLQAVDLAIQHVRNRCERMPVSGVYVGERPLNPV